MCYFPSDIVFREEIIREHDIYGKNRLPVCIYYFILTFLSQLQVNKKCDEKEAVDLREKDES